MHTRFAFPSLRSTVLAALVLCSSLAIAADGADPDPYWEYRDEVDRGEFRYDDSQDIPWIENETEVLAVPREEDLVQLDINQSPPGLQVWIDRSRITVDPKDRVVRLWVVMRSEQGVQNGTFEGYRCDTGEYKIYAYSNPHRKPPVSKANRPVWQEVGGRRGINYRSEMMSDYFCGLRGVRTEAEIRDAIDGRLERDSFFYN